MSLPWVSRLAYDGAMAIAKDLEDLLRAERDRFDGLLNKYHELAKGTPVHSTEPHELAPKHDDVHHFEATADGKATLERVPSVIAQAIKDEAFGDPKLARYLWGRARELRAENKKPEEIAKELRQWQTTEISEEG